MPSEREKKAKAARGYNMHNVPLLDTAGEIMNMIVAYLPPETAHVFEIRYGMFATRACHAPTSIDERVAKEIELATSLKLKTEVSSFSRRHANCVHSRPGKHVKRDENRKENSWFWNSFIHAHRVFQQYDGLLFANTTFIFSDVADVEKFKMVLLPFQRNAIRSIIINGGSIPPPPPRSSLPTHSLPGLENLLVFHETPWKEDPRNPPSRYSANGRPRGLYSRLSYPLINAFHGGKIEDLKVCLTAKRELKVEKDKSIVVPWTYEKVAGELEKMLGKANGVPPPPGKYDTTSRVSSVGPNGI